MLTAGEECDDGNPTPGDGCSESCRWSARDHCFAAARASLVVRERPGPPRLALALEGLTESTTREDFGDPVAGGTAVEISLYGAGGALAGRLDVARAGASCGRQPCWSPTRAGHRYRDPARAWSGVGRLEFEGGPAGDGLLRLRARGRALPPGIAAALAGATSARAQVVTSDGACFDTSLDEVHRNDGRRFAAELR